MSRQANSTGQAGFLQQSVDMDTDTFASMLANLVRSGSKAAEARSVGEDTSSCMLLVAWASLIISLDAAYARLGCLQLHDL